MKAQGVLVVSTMLIGASAAQAGEPFDIQLSGDAFFTGAAIRQNTDQKSRTVDFINRFRLVVNPSAVSDNGLSYGAHLRIEASLGSGALDSDLAYLYVRGGLGTVDFGLQKGPGYYYHVIAPTSFGSGGIDGDWDIGDAGLIQNQNTFLEPYFGGGYTPVTATSSTTRINYYSPRLFSQAEEGTGLLVMGSYAPTNRSLNADVTRQSVITEPLANAPYGYGVTAAYSNCGGGSRGFGCNYQSIAEAGLRYDASVSGVSLAASAGYVHGDTQDTNFGVAQKFYNLSAWQAGLQLSAADVTIGGSILDAGRSAYPKASRLTGSLFLDDQTAWTAGVAWQIGPMVLGFNYAQGHDAGDLTQPGARTAALYSIGASYTLAPGLVTGIEGLRSTTHNEANFRSDSQGADRTISGNANLLLWTASLSF